MFSSIRIAILLFFIAVIGAGYWYITKLQNDNQTLRNNNAQLQVAVDTANASVETYKQEFQRAQELNTKLQGDLQKAEAYSDELRSKFSRLDLVQDALKDAKNLEGRMNSATAKLWREFMANTGNSSERPLPKWLQPSTESPAGTEDPDSSGRTETPSSDSSTAEANTTN